MLGHSPVITVIFVISTKIFPNAFVWSSIHLLKEADMFHDARAIFRFP